MEHLKGAYSQHQTHAFILRLWQEETGADRCEWRGRLQPIPDGEVRYFRTWATLTTLQPGGVREIAQNLPINVVFLGYHSGSGARDINEAAFRYAIDSGGVSIAAATDSTHLRPRGRFEIGGAADLQVVDDLVYVAAGANGVLILRVHPECFPPAVFLPMLRQKSLSVLAARASALFRFELRR